MWLVTTEVMWLYLCWLLSVSAGISSGKDDIHKNGPETGKSDGRITGGEPVEDSLSFTYQVQMFVHGKRFCSGAIISNHTILTAAHCVADANLEDIHVRAGSHKLGKGMEVPIIAVAVPEEFDFEDHRMDIAVLRTMNDFEFSREFLPASFIDVGATLPDYVSVAGWGSQGDDGKLTDDLMAVELPVLSNLLCQSRYPEAAINKNLMCAEDVREGGKGTCKGDGGAPATANSFGRLVGISTFTRGCSYAIAPSVFTNVEAKEIRDFINKAITAQETATGEQSQVTWSEGVWDGYDDEDEYS